MTNSLGCAECSTNSSNTERLTESYEEYLLVKKKCWETVSMFDSCCLPVLFDNLMLRIHFIICNLTYMVSFSITEDCSEGYVNWSAWLVQQKCRLQAAKCCKFCPIRCNLYLINWSNLKDCMYRPYPTGNSFVQAMHMWPWDLHVAVSMNGHWDLAGRE